MTDSDNRERAGKSKRKGRRKPRTSKRMSRTGLLGQRGANALERVVLEMGSSWTPTGSLEVGIDGFIELFDPGSGEPVGAIVAAQSKALSSLANEAGDSFDYWCEKRDIEYWMRGNMPVILVVSRPDTGDAYWISVKDYFSRPENTSSTRVRFSKVTNGFTKESLPDLIALGRSRTEGLYLAPIPKVETLQSNLLQLEVTPPQVYVASTPLRSAGEVWAELRKANGSSDGAWLLRSKQIISFHDLSEPPWSSVCDAASCEGFSTDEWAESDDLDRQRQYVQLLNQVLRSQLWPTVRYWDEQDCYAYAGTPEEGTKKVLYRSLKKDSKLMVVAKYTRKDGDRTYVRLRHLAFRGHFRRFEGNWYLEITPTYRFTSDGVRLDRFHEDQLKTIKIYEGNRAVLSGVLFWARHLKPKPDLDLFEGKSPALLFGELLRFECPVGIDDKRWSARDPSPPRDTGTEGLFLPDLGIDGDE